MRGLLKSTAELEESIHSSALTILPRTWLARSDGLTVLRVSRDRESGAISDLREMREDLTLLERRPWLVAAKEIVVTGTVGNLPGGFSSGYAVMDGAWTLPYYSCQDKVWIISYVVPLVRVEHVGTRDLT